MNFKRTGLVVLLCLCLLLSACKSKEAKATDALIKDIGEVTLDSLEKIETAENSVEALTPEQKAELENLKVLEDARASYDFLVLDDAANKIEDSITGIGEVTSDKSQLIVDVRGEYNAAPVEVRDLVENYDDLVYAENRIKAIYIDEKIEKIIDVSLDNVTHFNTAYKAYSEAAPAVQEVCEYADRLLEYKPQFDAILSNEVVYLINTIGDVTVDDEQAITNARSQYDALSAEGKAMVSNYQLLVDAEPALEEAKEKAKEAAVNDALKRINTKTDKVEGITWYESNRKPYYVNTRSYILPYIGKRDSGYTFLRALYLYTGDDWIFYEKITFLVDGERTTKTFSYSDVERDNGSGDVWEYVDELPSASDIKLLWKIANSNETIVRFEGDSKRRDITISAADKQGIKDILTVYEAWTSK